MDYLIIPVTRLNQNCSLIWCEETRLSALVDPGGDSKKIKEEISKTRLTLVQILLTHGHLDHVGAASELSEYYNVPVIGPEKKDIFWLENLYFQNRMLELDGCHQSLIPNRWLNEGDIINVGNVTLQVFHCPGHTPGHIAYFENQSRFLISGDIIFRGGIGRSDFPGGNRSELISSIKEKLFPLGDDIKFIPGHGLVSTLGYERLHNPFLMDTILIDKENLT